MTSSLVGSEMCIRDRTKGMHQLSYSQFCKRLRRGRLGISPASKRVDAVSYTHLTLPTICSV
eukprot:6526132-Prorocentrum_lima.AAC.1